MTGRDWIVWAINLVVAAAAVWLAWRSLRAPRLPQAHSGWMTEPPVMDRWRLRTVAVPPALMLGEEEVSVRLWLPLREKDPERFRREPGALMLSAAMAVTMDRLPGDPAFHQAWTRCLRMDAANLARKHPRIDEVRVDGQPGVLVLDGLTPRGFFVGGKALAAACTHFLDGEIRRLGRADRAALEALPEGALIYATCVVEQQQAGSLVYLGAVLPIRRPLMDAGFAAARERLDRMGIATAFQPCDAATAQAAIAVWGGGLPFAAPGDPATLTLTPLEGNASTDFAEPVLTMLAGVRADRVRTLRGLALAAALALMAVCGGSFFLCTALCAVAVLIRVMVGTHDSLSQPPDISHRGLLLCLLPAGLVPLASGIAVRLLGNATMWLGFGSAMLCGAAVICWLCWLQPDETERGLARWLPPVCLAAAGVLSLLMAPLQALLGLAAGVACGLLMVKWLGMRT